MKLFKFPTFLPVFIVCLLGACSTAPTAPKTTTDFDANYNFSSVKNVAIQPVQRATVSTVMISDIQISRINQALTDELQAQGFRVVSDNTNADMFLVWHLVTQERLDVRSYNTSAGYNCWRCGGGSNVNVRQYTQGTFIVDMVDPTELRSKWRSSFDSRMSSQPEKPESAEFRRLAAEAILAGFPPGALAR